MFETSGSRLAVSDQCISLKRYSSLTRALSASEAQAATLVATGSGYHWLARNSDGPGPGVPLGNAPLAPIDFTGCCAPMQQLQTLHCTF